MTDTAGTGPITPSTDPTQATTVGQLPATSTAQIAGQDAFTYVQQNYPQEAWMLQVPELAQTIISIAEQQITDPTTIQSMIEATSWWQNNSDAARTFIEQEMTDPATAQANLQQQETAIAATFSQLGLKPSQNQINTFAYESLMNGWSTQQLMDHVGHAVQVNPDGSFQVATYYVDPSTGKEIDVFTGQEAYYGPQGEPATPTKPGNMAGWASWTQPDGTTVYYKPGTAMGVQTGANGAITGIGAVSTTPGQQWSGLSNVATLQNGRYVDNATGQPAYYGPDGEPGYPTQQAALANNPGKTPQSVQMPDGTTVWYVPGQFTYLGNRGQASPFTEGQGGSLQSTQQQLQQTAKSYLVNIDPQTLGQWSQQVAMGQTTTQAFQSYLQQTALSQYPWMKQGIQEGQTPLQLVNPYANMVSNELGISANSIDWTQPQWAKLLTTTGPDGQLAQNPLYNATQQVRSDPTYGWQNTPNGKAAAWGFVQNLQQAMGYRDYSGASMSAPAQYGSSGG